MEVISYSRMTNQSCILLEDRDTGRVRVCVCVCGVVCVGVLMCVYVNENEKAIENRKYMQREREKKKENDRKLCTINYPSCLAKPAGQLKRHSVHLCPLRASPTSKTFTKYPLTTHSLVFVSVVLFISLPSSLFLYLRLVEYIL